MSSHCPFGGGSAAVLALLLLPAAGLASDEPVNAPPARAIVQEVESLAVPAPTVPFDAGTRRMHPTVLVPTLVPADAEQRGGTMTDAAAGLAPAAPTPGELAKLDAARAAIEASRAAGTLLVTQLPEDTTPATREEQRAMKMQKLDAHRTTPLPPDPVAGIGEDLPPVQLMGPAGLTPAEQAKLRGEILPGQTVPPAPAPAPADAVGDGAPVRQPVTGSAEEVHHD